jgi:cytochrome c-type biogenesis protein CcmH/NrfF
LSPRPVVAAAWIVLLASVSIAPARQQTPPGHTHDEATESGPIVESPEAIQVTGVILCSCGGCVNQTLHECTCGLAAAERRKVAEALAAGATPEQLIARYIAEQGPQVRVVPERKGAHFIGWAVPYVAALAGLAALLAVLIAWRRRDQAAAAPEPRAPQPADADIAYRQRIERDLREAD